MYMWRLKRGDNLSICGGLFVFEYGAHCAGKRLKHLWQICELLTTFSGAPQGLLKKYVGAPRTLRLHLMYPLGNYVRRRNIL